MSKQEDGDQKWLIVVPAYGRDYKTDEEVVKAWNEDKDFLIQDVSCRYDNMYVNRVDAENQESLHGTTFKIRYNKKADYALIRKVNGKWICVNSGEHHDA